MSITSLQLIQISEYTSYKRSLSYSACACCISSEVQVYLCIVLMNRLNACVRQKVPIRDIADTDLVYNH